MRTHELTVSGRSIAQAGSLPLIRTSVGVDDVHILFDSEEWMSFPVSATFVNAADGEAVTTSLTLSVVETEWAAEATCEVPWEVMRSVGQVRLTLQGTNSSGDHIVTAYGAPLSVVEEGDAASSDIPQPAPTPSEWEQAYADAQSILAEAQELLSGFDEQIDQIIAEAADEIARQAHVVFGPATEDELGLVKIDGESITIDEDGVISADLSDGGMTDEQEAALANLIRLLGIGFNATYNQAGELTAAVAKPGLLPAATEAAAGVVKVSQSVTDSTASVPTDAAVHNALSAKANVESPAFTGTPTAPTPEAGDDSTRVATTGFVADAIAGAEPDLDGVLKYKGVLESYEDLEDITDPEAGDMYFVDDVSYFWDGEAWAVISPDLSPYELSSNLVRITDAEIHEITSHHGDYGDTQQYVTNGALQQALATQTAALERAIAEAERALEDYCDEQFEELTNGTY